MSSREYPLPTYTLATREDLLGLDLRSLALFRVGLALIIIVDLIERFGDLKAHYTDFGVLPRAVLIEKFLNSSVWSLHLFSGNILFQGILFVVAFICALALLVGYRTRLFTILSWVLLASLHSRNNMILNAGDSELRLLLFWGIFLPLGAYYSVDSALNSESKPFPKSIISGGTIALTLQICFVYWFTAMLKSHPIWWEEGTAVYYALNIDQLATPFSSFMLKFPQLLVFANFATLWIELLAPFLLFVPIKNSFFRCLTVFIFIGLHIGFRLGLVLGLFPYVCIISWLVLLPSDFWDWLSYKLQFKQIKNIKIYYNPDSSTYQKILNLLCCFLFLPKELVFSAQTQPEIYTAIKNSNSWLLVEHQDNQYIQFQALIYLCNISPVFRPLTLVLSLPIITTIGKKICAELNNINSNFHQLISQLQYRKNSVYPANYQNLIALLLLGFVLLWNLNSISPKIFPIPKIVRTTNLILRLDQRWGMFAPYPSREDGWYVIPGKLKNGKKIDLFKNGQPVIWDKPLLVSSTYPNVRWRKYMMKIWLKRHAAHRLYYGKYLCRDWNSKYKGEEQLDNFEIFFMSEKTLPNYQTPELKKVSIHKHYCFKKPDQ
ncbi:HTTM domain-containing protein [Okeania hirsuta]|uniref:HTTM domain-containing protein n=2 Tax=Okeania TaxID=1458928 RepID=A0A3N6PHP8_9CYAN|nr:HTTM domain-containing protein [Okeania hirsuta]RQH25828.1 HTTM domain-containing protein [Okeania hirsuta]